MLTRAAQLLCLALLGACATTTAADDGGSPADWRTETELGASYVDERAQRMARQSLVAADLIVGITDDEVWALSGDGALASKGRADDDGIAQLADSVAAYVASARERGRRAAALLFVVDETTEEHTPVELTNAINARLRERLGDETVELNAGTLRLRDAGSPF